MFCRHFSSGDARTFELEIRLNIEVGRSAAFQQTTPACQLVQLFILVHPLSF